MVGKITVKRRNNSNGWTKFAKTLINFESRTNGARILGENITVTLGGSHVSMTPDSTVLSRRCALKNLRSIGNHFRIGLNGKRKMGGNHRILRSMRNGLMSPIFLDHHILGILGLLGFQSPIGGKNPETMHYLPY
jgi:hypothetical protein